MDPRDRADELLRRARARSAYVVTPDSAISPMDASSTVQIPRVVVDSADPRNVDPDTTIVLTGEAFQAMQPGPQLPPRMTPQGRPAAPQPGYPQQQRPTQPLPHQGMPMPGQHHTGHTAPPQQQPGQPMPHQIGPGQPPQQPPQAPPNQPPWHSGQ